MEVIKNIFEFFREASRDYPYLTKSLFLHFCILILISGFIPSCSKEVEKPKVIAINIIQAKAPPKAFEKPKKQVVKKKATKPKPKKKEPPKKLIKKKVEKKAEKPKPKPKPKPKKKEAPLIKKEEPKKVEKKKKPEKTEDKKVQTAKKDQEGKKSLLKDLTKTDDSLSDLIEKIEKEEPKKVEKKKPEKVQPPKKAEWVPDAEFVSDIEGKLQSQVSNHWSIPIGAENVENMRVRLFIALDPEGNVIKAEIMDTMRYNSDNYYRVLADSAIWAVKEASPIRGLPRDKHNFWKEIEFTFDPAYIL